MQNLWLDVKYAGLLSVQLEKYKVKQQNPYLANFRCPVCGDSERNKNKARGYIYTKASSLYFKCHNCSSGYSLPNLIKMVNPSLYDQYTLERYKEGLDLHAVNKPKHTHEFSFTAPTFNKTDNLKKLFVSMDQLDSNNPAYQYLESRKIPHSKYSSLYYIENVQDLEKLNDKYKDKIIGDESRIGIPFYDKENKLVALSCRAIDNNSLRYLTIRLDESASLIYNLPNIDKTKQVYCVEGPIDSMFLPNCIAVGNADLNKIENFFSKLTTTLIFDNQPRNFELVKLMRRAADNNYNIVIWPDTIIEKDINEMIINGKTSEQILQTINTNTFSGISLRLKLNTWSKC